MAISFPLALSEGPLSLQHQAFVSRHFRTGLCFSSRSWIVTLRVGGKVVPPSRTSFRQSHRTVFPQTPLLQMRFPYFSYPTSLRTVFIASAPSRYSIGVFSLSRPETSWNAAICAPSISTVKLKAEYGLWFGLGVAIAPSAYALFPK